MNHRTKSNAAIYILFLLLTAGCDSDDDLPADRAGIGAECTNSDDCFSQDQSCLLQFSGGYCAIANCESNQDCPNGSACVAHDDGIDYCFRICVTKEECNRNRSVENEANCSSDIVFVEEINEQKACVPPSSGMNKK